MNKTFTKLLRNRFLSEVPEILPEAKRVPKSRLGALSYADWCLAAPVGGGAMVFIAGDPDPKHDWYTVDYGWSRDGQFLEPQNSSPFWVFWLSRSGSEEAAYAIDHAVFSMLGDDPRATFWHFDDFYESVAKTLTEEERCPRMTWEEAKKWADELYLQTLKEGCSFPEEAWKRDVAEGFRYSVRSEAGMKRTVDKYFPLVMQRIEEQVLPILNRVGSYGSE
jgi:hypothetical protein